MGLSVQVARVDMCRVSPTGGAVEAHLNAASDLGKLAASVLKVDFG